MEISPNWLGTFLANSVCQESDVVSSSNLIQTRLDSEATPWATRRIPLVLSRAMVSFKILAEGSRGIAGCPGDGGGNPKLGEARNPLNDVLVLDARELMVLRALRVMGRKKTLPVSESLMVLRALLGV